MNDENPVARFEVNAGGGGDQYSAAEAEFGFAGDRHGPSGSDIDDAAAYASPPRADQKSAPVARIAPRPREIIVALAELRLLHAKTGKALVLAFDAQDLELPADTIAALGFAADKLGEAQEIARREIVRLRELSKGVTYQPSKGSPSHVAPLSTPRPELHTTHGKPVLYR